MKKELYTAPVLEVMEAKVEKGFAGSGDFSGNTDITNQGGGGGGTDIGNIFS